MKQPVQRLPKCSQHGAQNSSQGDSFATSHQSLPHEILGYIFSLVAEHSYDYMWTRPPLGGVTRRIAVSSVDDEDWISRCPFNVARVSRRWREVAHSTPLLWNSLIVDTNKKEPAKMMRYWFKHARAVPMEVTIWQEELWTDYEGITYEQRTRIPPISELSKVIRAIVDELASHIHQVQSLKICCEEEPDPHNYVLDGRPRARAVQPPDILVIFSWLENLPPFTTLRSLTVDNLDLELKGANGSAQLPALPQHLFASLRTLHMRGFCLSNNSLSAIPTQLTVLKLDYPSTVQEGDLRLWNHLDILSLLESLPLLERLRLKGAYLPPPPMSSNASPQPGEFVRLDQLRTLTISGRPFASYLSRLITPNLTKLKLKWQGYSLFSLLEEERAPLLEWTGIGALVTDLLKRSQSPPLAQLNIRYLGKDFKVEDLRSWLDLTPDLRHLIIVQPAEWVESALAYVLESDGDGSTHIFCSGLELLEWHSTDRPIKVNWGNVGGVRLGLTIRPYAVREGALPDEFDMLDLPPDWEG